MSDLELAEQAVIDGDVYYNLVEMAVGAKVNGGMRHTSAVADDLAAKREAKAADTVTRQLTSCCGLWCPTRGVVSPRNPLHWAEHNHDLYQSVGAREFR